MRPDGAQGGGASFDHGEATTLRDLTGKHSERPAQDPVGEIDPVEILLELAPDGMIVVRGGRIVTANPPALRMFGYDMSEMAGLSLGSLLPKQFLESHSGLRPNYDRDPQKRPMRSTATLDALARDGREFPAEVGLRSVGSGDDLMTVVSIRDVGERLAAEDRLQEEIDNREGIALDREELRRKASHLETINAFALSLIKVSTLDEILWDVARNAVARLGFEDCVVYLLDEQTGHLVQRAAYGPKNPVADDIYEPITIPVGDGIVGSVAATGHSELVRDTRLDPRYITDDTSRRSELAVPIVRKGKVIGVVDSEHHEVDFYTEDHRQILTTIASMASAKIDTALALEQLQGTVARLTEAEGRLEHVAEDLRQARDTAEKASQAKSDFMAVMSHEIRTPMNAILGMTDLVLNTSLSRDQRSLLQTAQTNAEALLDIINGVLDFSKLEAGALQLSPTDFGIVDVVEGVMEALAARAADKHIVMTAVLSPDLASVVRGDAGRFRQVLVNLVGNAVKFTPEGGRVLVRAEPVSPDSNRVRIEVTDTGIGISQEDSARIFQPFYQADQSLARPFEGTGLGLGITYSLLSLMGGQIEVSSELGVGTTFLAEVPFEPSNHVFHELRDSDRSFVDVSVRLAVADPDVHEATVALVEALGIEVVSEHDAGKDLHFLIVDGGEPGGACGERVDEEGLTRPGEKILLLCPHGSRPKTGPPARSMHVISKPLTRRKLADALVDEADPSDGSGHFSDGLHADEKLLHPKILVVEDSRDNQRYVLRVLEDASFSPDLAVDGEEGAAMAIAGNYDVVVTDVQMPKVDGLEMTRRIRSAESESGASRIPIIALTAHAGEGFRERCLAAGMDAHLSKPFRGPELTGLIETFLGHRRTVLVVDDDRASRQLVTRFLEHERLRVEGVGTMADARRRLDEGFDLILLDRNLPDGDGLELARELAALPESPAVIIITGHVGPEHRLAAEDVGAGYLSKPLRRPKLLSAVRNALVKHEAEPDHGDQNEVVASDSEVVLVEGDIADLVEEFLDDWRAHALDMEALLAEENFTELYRLGHNLKGSGAGYGFPELSGIGEAIEHGATQKLPLELGASIEELRTYLSQLRWHAE